MHVLRGEKDIKEEIKALYNQTIIIITFLTAKTMSEFNKISKEKFGIDNRYSSPNEVFFDHLKDSNTKLKNIMGHSFFGKENIYEFLINNREKVNKMHKQLGGHL